jgi:LAS superfamily LD-carboxypeptidase LdcB
MVSVAGQNLKSAYSNPKKRTEKILNYSSMPGTSRHHWGTDIDINNKSPDYWNTEKGMKEYSWLSTHAKEFGFCQTYNTKEADRATGYNTEKWHWSYTPLAKNLLIQYEETVNYSDITGFPGSKTAEELNIIEDYVSSINPECR